MTFSTTTTTNININTPRDSLRKKIQRQLNRLHEQENTTELVQIVDLLESLLSYIDLVTTPIYVITTDPPSLPPYSVGDIPLYTPSLPLYYKYVKIDWTIGTSTTGTFYQEGEE